MLHRLLLAAAGGSGAFVAPPAEPMTSQETAFWRDAAALLDPAAYELIASTGSAESTTVPSDETYYLVGGWRVDVGSVSGYLRTPNALWDAMPMPEGTTLTTDAASGAHLYVCKPSLVNSDTRYTSDPRGLFFDRMYRIATELTQYDVNAAPSSGSNADTAFPTDFTNGIILWVSVQDASWAGLLNAAETLTFNLQNEISDSDPIRFGTTTYMPFVRTAFPKFRGHGAASGSGHTSARYVKLPGDW